MELDFQRIFHELNESMIDYLVIGGLAVNFYGIPRLTYDIDIMILLHRDNIKKVVAKLTEWGFRPRVPVEPMDLADDIKRNSLIKEKGMKAMNFYHPESPIAEIDIVIDSPIPYEVLKTRSVIFELYGEKIPVISIHDLIKIKENSEREQDLTDAKYLKMLLER